MLEHDTPFVRGEGMNKAELEQRRLHADLMRSKCDTYFPINTRHEIVWLSDKRYGDIELKLISRPADDENNLVGNYRVDFYLSNEGLKYFGIQNEMDQKKLRVNIFGDNWHANIVDQDQKEIEPAIFKTSAINPLPFLFFSLVAEYKPNTIKKSKKSA